MKNPIALGWRLGGWIGARLATVYLLGTVLGFYLLVVTAQGSDVLWGTDVVTPMQVLAGALVVLFMTLIGGIVPIGMAWLAGSVAGALTGVGAMLPVACLRGWWWGMFCFSLPPLVFHAVADLRPVLVSGDSWVNSYWLWVGIPSLVCVLAGGWVGEQIARQAQWARSASQPTG